jgi:hypothetical protein
MRKIILSALILSSVLFLSTCDLFTPGFGNNVDLSPPLLFVTSHANGAFVSGSIAISGNFEEDVAVSSINISFDNGVTFAPATLNQTARTWTITVNTTLITDGEHDVLFRITDTSNKVTDKKILLYFDNTPPLVMMTAPSVYGMTTPAYYGVVTVKGEAADTFGMQNITIRILNSSDVQLVQATANGTSSWSYSFDSSTYIAMGSAGVLKFVIIGTDRAGNTTTTYYHYSDIYAANSYVPIVIDDIYRVYTDQLTNAPVKNYLAANGTTPIPYYFDQNLSKPTIEVYNPDNSGASNNILTSTSRLSGKAIDEETIAANKVEVKITQGATTIIDWTSTGNALAPSVSWAYVLPGAPPMVEGDYELTVRAWDVPGNLRTSPLVSFKIDSGAPTLIVNQPTQGQYLNGNFTVTGSATDNQGIKRVEVSLDDGLTYNNASLTPTTDATPTPFTYTVSNPLEGSMLIKVRAVENTIEEKKSNYNMQVIIDKTNPTVGFLNPAFSGTVNGYVLIKGTSSDNTQITNVELRLGKDPNWIAMSNLYNWEYGIDTTAYANSTYADNLGGTVWQMYIHARVTDRAGNIYTKDDYYFLIDNDTDKPNISILSPQDGATIGGSTVVSGTAVDDDGLYRVYMNLELDNNTGTTITYDLNGNSSTGSQINTVAGMAIGDQANLFENEAFWYELSGTTQWSVELNKNGELYNMGGSGIDRGKITVRIVAVDSKDGGTTPGIKGNNQARSFRFDDTIPGFENMSHDSNSFVRKTFNFTGRAVDNQHVAKVEISYNGGVNWTPVYEDIDFPPYVNSYDFSTPGIEINTETINGGVFASSSGILYLRLRALDNTGYTKLQLIDLKVDNSYPTSTYSGSLTDINGSTTNSFVQGTAEDSGPVSGTKQVEVYFMRGSTVYNPHMAGSTTLTTTDLGDGTGFQYYTTDDNFRIVIDNKYENGLSDLDGDGFKETFTVQGNNTLWSTQFNSSFISDGAITIHYVAVDMALNKHHYSTSGFIKNYKPIVSGMTVGSDVDFSNSVDGDEQYAYSLATYSSSNRFKARNRLLITVTASDPGGTVPGITNYNFLHEGVSVQSSASNTLDTDLTAYANGDTYFTCVITDGDNITTTSDTFWINIDKNDTTNPTVGIDEFDADGNPDNNIVTGHIELPADSKFDNGVTNGDGINDDADVSGIILLTGSAWDNFYISSIQLTLDGLAPYPSPKTVAQWDNGTHQMVSMDSNFTIIAQNITPAGGHTVTWSYRWDTSSVTLVAGANKSALFASADAGARNGTNSKTYDVVPYISGLLRSIGAEGTTRSRYGKFSVQQGESNLQINGYNLAKTGTYGTNSWVRVYNTAGTAQDEVANAKVSANGTFTTITISQFDDVTHSGWLRILVNNVEATNNINDPTKNNNKENDGSGMSSTLWTDDRYLQLWQTGAYFGTAGQSYNAEYPSMSINSTGTLYGAWMNRAGSRIYYSTPGAAQNSIYYSYDPPEYTDVYIDSGNNVNIAYLANNFMGNWGDANLGCVALWSNSTAPPLQASALPGYNNNYHEMEDIFHDQMLLQFQRPKIARYNNNMHVAYYDSDTSSVKYGYVVSTNASANELTPWINLDGGSDGEDTQILTNVLDSTPNRSTSAGEYVAIDVDENGLPVVLYYDIANQTLRLARATTTTPNSAASWARQDVFQSGDTNKQYSGKFVSMKFDTNGNLYVVCYNTANGDLIYLYAPDADGADYAFTASVKIDTVGAVGAWADISLNGTTPYISYLNSSMIGTFSGLKMAYYDTGRSAWEYSTVPLATAIQDSRTNIEYAKGAVTWTSAIGYKGTNFDIVYQKPEE